MSADILLINIVAIALIIFVLWWFFGAHVKAKIVGVEKPITILVKDGIYQPARIQVPVSKPVTLQFLREDATQCAAVVLFPQLNASYPLPLNQTVTIVIPPQNKRELDFTCQMGMYKGKLIFF